MRSSNYHMNYFLPIISNFLQSFRKKKKEKIKPLSCQQKFHTSSLLITRDLVVGESAIRARNFSATGARVFSSPRRPGAIDAAAATAFPSDFPASFHAAQVDRGDSIIQRGYFSYGQKEKRDAFLIPSALCLLQLKFFGKFQKRQTVFFQG